MWYIVYQTDFEVWKYIKGYKDYDEACYYRDKYYSDYKNVIVMNKHGMMHRVEGMLKGNYNE